MTTKSVGAEQGVPLSKVTSTGSPPNGQLFAEETKDLLASALSAMKADLAECPAWSGAPSPPKDEFLLMFLRAHMFCPSAAAKRYRKFWKSKVALCDKDRAASPIKVEDAVEGLKTNYIQLVPGSRDNEGRQVVLMNPGNMDKTVDKRIRVLAVWYVILAALDDVDTQRRGICFLVVTSAFKRSQKADFKFTKMAMGSMQGALPVRIGSINICHPPSFFQILWATVNPFLHERVKKRIRIMSGTSAEVRQALADIVTLENLPTPLGEKAFNFPAWLAERVRNEARSS